MARARDPSPSLGETDAAPHRIGEDELPELMLPPPIGLELLELDAPAPPGPLPG
jgi:hypothetical protein